MTTKPVCPYCTEKLGGRVLGQRDLSYVSPATYRCSECGHTVARHEKFECSCAGCRGRRKQ